MDESALWLCRIRKILGSIFLEIDIHPFFNFADHGIIVGTALCNLRRVAVVRLILYIVHRREYTISKRSWDRHQQCLVTLAPSLEAAADIFLMGHVGSRVGFASEKTVFVKKEQSPKTQYSKSKYASKNK